MPPTNIIETAASRLREASQTGKTCSPIRELIGEKDVAMAYAIQTTNSEVRIAAGARPVGRKIGLTSESIQKQLGVDQPDYGMLFDTMEVSNGGIIPWKEVMQPKVEAEIAFVLEKDLASPSLTIEDVKEAIDYAIGSLEIVGSRIQNWDITIADTIADNASASHFVLGGTPQDANKMDLENCRISLAKNGEVVSEGKGSNCMDSPLNAALWLAKAMVDLGTPLRKGDIILSGACSAMVNAEPGDSFTAVFDDLGKVSVSFSA